MNGDRSRAIVFVLGLKENGEKPVSLGLTGLAEGAKYDIAEINCAVPHDAKLDGCRLGLALRGPYDSAVFELRYAREL